MLTVKKKLKKKEEEEKLCFQYLCQLLSILYRNVHSSWKKSFRFWIPV